MSEILNPVKGCKVVHKLDKNIFGLVESIHNECDDFWIRVRLSNHKTKDIQFNNIKCGFLCGDYIEHISDKSYGVGKVMALRTIADCEMVLVQFTNTALNKWLPYQVLRQIIAVETRAIHGILGNEIDHAERFRLRVLSKALQFWDENTGALGRLGIDPLPHQVYVAQKVITSGNYSWLIADDVGLGKTIEVGLILHALSQRKICKRILVVCPSGLVKNWQNEMKNKFEKDFSIYNIDFTPDNSDRLYLNGGDCVIVSLDLAKKEKHKNILINGKWDIVIFDEAHRLNKAESGQESERYKLAK